MKNIIVPALLLLAGCQNVKTEANTTKSTEPAHTNHQMAIAHANDIIDPVCGMVKDSTWTDYTLYKCDTVWFCAAGEKVVFDRNPKRYESKLKKHGR